MSSSPGQNYFRNKPGPSSGKSSVAGASRSDAALAIVGEDLGATRILRLLERWPAAAALAEDNFTAPEHLARAKIDKIRLTTCQLLLIDARRAIIDKSPRGQRR